MKSMLFAAIAAFAAIPAAAQESPAALADAFCDAVEAEDTNALAALYTEDADSYGPDGSIVKGRTAIGESWIGFFAAFDDLSCTLDLKGEAMGKHSHTAWGLWTLTGTPAGGAEPVVMKGRYMDVAVKTKAGWLYRADHASTIGPEG